MPVPFAANENLAAVPVQVVELQSSHFSRTQAQANEQREDGVVASADYTAPVATGQQSLDQRRVDPARQRTQPPTRYAGYGSSERGVRQPCHVQVPQQRTQARDQVLRRRNTAPRTFPSNECRDVRSAQAAEFDGVDIQLVRQEQAADAR